VPFFKKKIGLYLLILSNLGCSTSGFAGNFCTNQGWCPILTASSGLAISPNLGTSQHFSAEPPGQGETFNYMPQQTTQASAFFAGFIGLEQRHFSQGIIQIGLEYNQTSPFKAIGNFNQGIDSQSADTYSYHYTVLSRQVLLEGKWLATVNKVYHPYMMMGFGPSFNSAYNYSTDVSSFLTFTRDYQSHTSKSFSYALGSGIDIDITPAIRAGLGYRLTDYGKVSLGNATIDTTPAAGTLSQQHLYTQQVVAQVSYTFA
jgi:opacity protein-like surface antigen